MDLVERLESYEVTAVPPRSHLHLVWTAPTETHGAEPDEPDAGAAGAAPESGQVLPLLASYRITFVPVGAAS